MKDFSLAPRYAETIGYAIGVLEGCLPEIGSEHARDSVRKAMSKLRELDLSVLISPVESATEDFNSNFRLPMPKKDGSTSHE